MTKRVIIVGLGAIIGTRIAMRVSATVRKQMQHKMREHCKQMVSQCKQTAADFRDRQPAAMV